MLKDSGVKVENSWWMNQRMPLRQLGGMPITYTEFYVIRELRGYNETLEIGGVIDRSLL